jgi:hypothetical protein
MYVTLTTGASTWGITGNDFLWGYGALCVAALWLAAPEIASALGVEREWAHGTAPQNSGGGGGGGDGGRCGGGCGGCGGCGG